MEGPLGRPPAAGHERAGEAGLLPDRLKGLRLGPSGPAHPASLPARYRQLFHAGSPPPLALGASGPFTVQRRRRLEWLRPLQSGPNPEAARHPESGS